MEDEVYETPSASPISLCYAKTLGFLFHYLRSGSRLISMTNSRPRARRIYLIKLMLFAMKERKEGVKEGGRDGGKGREGREGEREEGREGWLADIPVPEAGSLLVSRGPFCLLFYFISKIVLGLGRNRVAGGFRSILANPVSLAPIKM